jgi:glycosyltransferase involved in cell wall biosynthesis
MKYPNILFFRHEKYAAIDTFLSVNEEKLNCNLNFTSDPNDILKLFDCNYHILVTYGESEQEYYASMVHLVNRMRLRWIHFKSVEDLDAFNRGVNYCYIHNVVIPHETTRPVFSAFTTCYNSYHKFLRPYQSLKLQTMRDWEWVVLDDSPDEKHFAFLKELVGKDPRVRLYRRAINSGNIGNVKNEVASMCRGKYVLELDHDDEILPECLGDAVKAFETDPEVGFVYMDGAHLYENRSTHSYGDHFGLGYAGYYCQKYQDIWINVISSPNMNNISMSHIVGLPNHPRIWKRSVLNEIGNYSEYLPICDDQELIMRTAVKTKIARVHKLAYIQYMNDGWNNFSLIRNSEINRLGPQFIVPQAYQQYKLDDHMKTLGVYESPEYGWWTRPIWKRPEFNGKFCNSILNFDYTKQYCILGYKALVERMESLRELYTNPKNDFFVLENSMSKEELCSRLDGLGLSRMKCYALQDCTWNELRNYFLMICKSTKDYEILDSSESACSIPHTSLLEPEVLETVQECTVDVASYLQSESPVQE